MKSKIRLRTMLATVIFCAAVAWPMTTHAQGRGRGMGRGIGLERKPSIFVNGRDARDGRFDERGPRMNRGFIIHRGRGIGLSRKSRFINGHDARNGRFDGRGPRIGLRHRHRHFRHGRIFMR